MSTQRTSDFLHGLDAAAHGLSAPEVQEQAGPMWRVVGPELLEVLLEQVSADGFQIVAKQIAEAELLLGGEILLALEHAPARLFQQWGMSVACQPARFGGTNLIQGLVHLGDDVEAVQDMQGQGTLLADHVQVGLPHIGADKQNPGSHLLAPDGKEALEGFYGAFQRTLLQANVDDIFDRVTDPVPGGVERLRSREVCPPPHRKRGNAHAAGRKERTPESP